MLNHRGHAGMPLTSPKLYSPKSYEDVEEVVEMLAEKHPGRQIYLVGSSLGGALVGNYLGRSGKRCKATAAVLVNSPIHLPSAVRNV